MEPKPTLEELKPQWLPVSERNPDGSWPRAKTLQSGFFPGSRGVIEKSDYSTETNYVRDYIWQTFRNPPMEGTYKMQLRWAAKHIEANWPGKYDLESIFDRETSLLTFKVTNLETNQLVISIMRDVTYFTAEDYAYYGVDDL